MATANRPDYSGIGGGSADGLSTFGFATSIIGALMSGVGAYYSVQGERAALKSQALTAKHQEAMSQINARAAEFEAQAIAAQGRRVIGRQTGIAGAKKGAIRTVQAASGVELGTGSAAQAVAAADIEAAIDRMDIETDMVSRMNAARTQGVNFRNEGLMAGVSAANLRRSAGSLSPSMAATTSLIGNAGTVAREWRYASRERRSY